MITSLNNIPEELDDEKHNSSITESSHTVTERTIDLDNIQPKQSTITQIKEISHNYMKRGALNTDRLLLLVRSACMFKLNDRDQMLLDILKQDVIDLKYEENQNVVIYTLRKKLRNELEVNFLLSVVKNLPFFTNSSAQQEAKDNAQFKRIVQALQYRHVSKHEIIFNYGEKGTEFFTVIKGAAFCLIPDPSYKKLEAAKKAAEPIKLIEQKANESKAESAARLFLNTIAQSVNKKNKIENNVLNFVDIIRGQLKKKVKKPARMLMRSTTKQLEDMFNEEEKLNDTLTDTEFLKQNYPGFILVKTFLPGDSFGEIALLTQQNRSATLVAKEESDFMVLDKEGFDKTMSYLKQNTIREKIEFIKSFEFFSTLSTKRVLQLIQQFKIIRVDGRQNIYEEGDNSNFFFLIRDGEVELQNRYNNPQELVKQFSIESDENNDETKDLCDLRVKKAKINVNKLHTVKILGQNSYFGEEEIVKNLQKREGKAICKGQGAQIYAIEKKRLHQVLGYHIFDRFKEAVNFKDELKSERLKNVIKMQIPQKDISNLNEFLEKDKKKKQFEIQKEELKQVLSKKQKMSFQNRFKDIENNLDSDGEISDSEVQEYHRVKNLEQQKKAFFRIHDKVTQMQKNTLELTPNYQNPNVIQPIFPVKEQRKSFRYMQVATLDDYKMNQELKTINKQTTPKIEIRRTSKMVDNLDNSLDEYIQKSARTLQIKSFSNLLEIEDKPIESEKTTPYDAHSKPQSETRILLNDFGSGDETTKDKFNSIKSYNMTKTDKLILNLSKSSNVQKQLKLVKDQQQALTTKSKSPQPIYEMYNFQKSGTPSQHQQAQQQQEQEQQSSPQKQKLQNSSKKILQIAGTGLFTDEVGNLQQQNSYASPRERHVISIASSGNNTIQNKQIKRAQMQNQFHVRQSSKSQVSLNIPLEQSSSQLQLNNSHTGATPSDVHSLQLQGGFNTNSSQNSSTYRFQLGTFSVPNFTASSSIVNLNSMYTSKQTSQSTTAKNATDINNRDTIIEEAPVSEFVVEKTNKQMNLQRRSLVQHNSSKDVFAKKQIIFSSPIKQNFQPMPFDESAYLKKPLSSRAVKKEIAPHKIRPITKLDNQQYFNSVLHNSNQDAVFRNINISQQQLATVRSSSQLKRTAAQNANRTLQNFHKNPNPEIKEESKQMCMEQFRKRVSALNSTSQSTLTNILPDQPKINQETNSSSMSMLRIRRSQMASNNDDAFSKSTARINSSHQMTNKSAIHLHYQSQPQQSLQQHNSHLQLAVLSSKYSDNRKILF